LLDKDDSSSIILSKRGKREMSEKVIVIREVALTDAQLEDRCGNCSLNLSGQCSDKVKSFLVSSHDFKQCELGYNYKVDDLETDYTLDGLKTPTTLDGALAMLKNQKTINTIQRFTIRKQRDLLREIEELKELVC
jgi:hypothetical protein